MQINAFYGAKGCKVGESVKQEPVTIPDKTEVEFVSFAAGRLGDATSGERVTVLWNGIEYSVLASQVSENGN